MKGGDFVGQEKAETDAQAEADAGLLSGRGEGDLPAPQRICRAIASLQVDLTSEKRTQADLAEKLRELLPDLPFEREKRFGKREVVDFFFVCGIVVEVKLKGARKREVWEQLCRYARHDEVKGLILATNLSMGLPEEAEGKPCWYVSLGRAWL